MVQWFIIYSQFVTAPHLHSLNSQLLIEGSRLFKVGVEGERRKVRGIRPYSPRARPDSSTETSHLPNTAYVIEEFKTLPDIEIGSYFLGSGCHVRGSVMKAGFDQECGKSVAGV